MKKLGMTHFPQKKNELFQLPGIFTQTLICFFRISSTVPLFYRFKNRLTLGIMTFVVDKIRCPQNHNCPMLRYCPVGRRLAAFPREIYSQTRQNYSIIFITFAGDDGSPVVNKLYRHISSVVLALLFLTPTLVKMEHHHEHFVCHATDEKHLHEQHERCGVCNFEFSLLEDVTVFFFTSQSQPSLPEFRAVYDSFAKQTLRYSFMLRAPPFIC